MIIAIQLHSFSCVPFSGLKWMFCNNVIFHLTLIEFLIFLFNFTVKYDPNFLSWDPRRQNNETCRNTYSSADPRKPEGQHVSYLQALTNIHDISTFHMSYCYESHDFWSVHSFQTQLWLYFVCHLWFRVHLCDHHISGSDFNRRSS